VNNLGATEEEQKKQPTVELKDKPWHQRPHQLDRKSPRWHGRNAGGALSVTRLGDLFLQKLVRVMPTLHDKKRAVEISHEIQENISKYLFSVSLISNRFGCGRWRRSLFDGCAQRRNVGMLVAVLNFVPYFGPVAGITLLPRSVSLPSTRCGPRSFRPPGICCCTSWRRMSLRPLLLGRRFTLNPVVIFVSLIFWTWLWGVPGALLSVPILVSVKVICDHVPSLASINELLAN